MKRSYVWFKIVALIFAMSFLFAIGCAKKKSVETQPVKSAAGGISGGVSEDELAEKRKAAEAEKLKKAAMEKFVNDDVHFDFDDAAIRTDAQEILKEKVKWLKANPGVSVTIEGHCDERGTEAYNLALGERRARSIKSFMTDAGIDNTRLNTISYGEESPIDPGHNEAAWAKNRRGHFHIN